MNLLIIEDELSFADAIARLFEKNNFIVQIALDGQRGFEYASSNIYDLIILDIMLPKIDGFTLIEKLRLNGVTTPILCLTAKSALRDEIQGFTHGADDYLTKPVSFEKLLVRAKALLRRGSIIEKNILTLGNISLNLDNCILSSAVAEIKLPSKEFHLMSLLMKKQNSYISKEEILSKIWGLYSETEYNTVEVYISFLRRKLNYLKSNVLIKVNRNIGYQLEVNKNDN